MATAGLLTCILKLMASGLPEKMSVTILLTAIRRLQQRDCPGFSPDSLLITTHKPCLRRQEVAANQLRLQRYNKKMNKRLFYLLFYSTSDKIIFHSFPVLFFYSLILSFYSLSILCFQKHLFFYDFQKFCKIIDNPFGRGELLAGSVAISHGTGLAAGMMRHIHIEIHITNH